MRLIKGILSGLLALSGATYAQAAEGSAGAESFQFLFLDANARSIGMGGAYTALATDSNALLYNPAGLGMVGMHEATFMHNQYFQSATQEYMALATKQGLGASLNFLNYGSLSRTTYGTPNGNGSFGASDMALSGGYGRKVLEDPGVGVVSVGAGLKYIRETIDNVSANAVALDVGTLYAPSQVPGLKAGLALQNLGPRASYQGAKENLPVNGRLGLAYGFNLAGLPNTVAVDVSKARTSNTVVGFGFESIVAHVMALRIGYNNRNNAGIGISGGVGFAYEQWRVDYAIRPFGDLGLAQQISVTLRWGAGKAH